MKRFLLVVNIILIAAVGYLYYNSFFAKKNTTASNNSERVDNKEKNSVKAPIAYIELDSLNEQISYIKDKRKELEAEQKAIEKEWENGYRRLQAQKDNFLKKGSATPAEMEQMQNSLIKQQQQIDGAKQTKSQKLSEKGFAVMDGIQKKLKEFLAEYNKEKNYMYILTVGSGLDYMVYRDTTLNITKDIIAGLNEKLMAADKK